MNRSNDLAFMELSGASMEWLDMVVQCRSNSTYRYPYDIVTGKITNDSLSETVSFVIQGIMRKEDTIERLKFENSTTKSHSTQRRHSIRFVLSEAIQQRGIHGSRNNQSNISSGNRKADFGRGAALYSIISTCMSIIPWGICYSDKDKFDGHLHKSECLHLDKTHACVTNYGTF